MAACRRAQGRFAEAGKLIEEAYEMCRHIGMQFIGPTIYTAKASAATDPETRRRLLEEGEAILSANRFALGPLMFYREAMDISIEHENWMETLRYADALESFMRPEPLVFSSLVISRARVLTALAREGRTPKIDAELVALRERIVETGIRALLPLVERALAQNGAPAA
jgi:hypothetical protein